MIEESIRIRPSVLVAIEAHARDVAPDECCGLVIARDGRLVEAVPVVNRAADPSRRYEIDPADFLAALKRCRGTDAIVIGAYHSHPRSRPEPSPSDRGAAFSDFLYLIAGPTGGPEPFAIRGYRLRDGNFHDVRLVPDPEDA